MYLVILHEFVALHLPRDAALDHLHLLKDKAVTHVRARLNRNVLGFLLFAYKEPKAVVSANFACSGSFNLSVENTKRGGWFVLSCSSMIIFTCSPYPGPSNTCRMNRTPPLLAT